MFAHARAGWHERYGRIVDIDLKSPSRPPAFAFVDFDDYRAAEDAVRGRGTRRILQLRPKLLRFLPRPTHTAHRTDADLADGAWQTA